MEITPVGLTQPIVIGKPLQFSKYADKQRIEYAPLNSYKDVRTKRYYYGKSLNYLI